MLPFPYFSDADQTDNLWFVLSQFLTRGLNLLVVLRVGYAFVEKFFRNGLFIRSRE